ncbi:MAG: IS1182 family transposase [Actinobacteria bacterium]|nr:IS1182 family transposase [Actinomycetota bacterium]
MQGKSDPNVEFLDAAALCGHLVRAGSVHAFLAEHRQRLFPDDLFVDLFKSARGRPSVPADVVATVMVLQALESLSDREAVDRLRTDITWKVAAGRALTDEGFHSTVLTLWRNKLRDSNQPQRIFDAVRAVVAETGMLKGKTRRALDSTVLDDAVATQDTVTQLVAAIRRVRRLVPQAAALDLAAHDYESPGKPAIAWDDAEAREALITALVTDALQVLAELAVVELDDVATEAIGLLGLVAGQDVEPGEDEGSWRIARKTAPDRVVSTVDTESRHIHKTVHEYRDGYKAHIAIEPDTGIVTAATLTAGNVTDAAATETLLAGEEPGLEIYADSAYASGANRVAIRGAGHDAVIKAIPLRRAVPGGFDRDDFVVDHRNRTVTCPAGHTIAMTPTGNAVFGVRCGPCPLRAQCTTAKAGKTVHIRVHDDELVYARQAWRDDVFREHYRQHRPMVERSLAWLVRGGNRRVRYRGAQRNQQWLTTRIAALNLRRLLNLGLHRDDIGWAIA